MITGEKKYIADVFKILGFAFMTPLGNFILNIREEIKGISIGFFIYLAFVLLLSYLGMVFLVKGLENVLERKYKKWNQYNL